MRINIEVSMAFAIQALLVDGLRVIPFVVHEEGSSSLRRAGLTPAIWIAWVSALLDLRAQLSGLRFEELDVSSHEFRPLFHPVMACPGPPGLRESLSTLWREKRDAMNLWQRRTSSELGGRYWTRVWSRAKGADVNGIRIHIVPYPETTLMPLGEDDFLLGIAGDEPADALGAFLTQAIADSG